MPLSNVNITQSNGNLAGTPVSDDGVSGLLYYGSSGTVGIYQIFQASDALAFCSSSSKLYYHITRFYRKTQNTLYVQIVSSSPSDFNEIEQLKNFSNGSIRIIGILNDKIAYDSTDLSAINTAVLQCETEKAPLSALYSAAISSVSGSADLRLGSYANVSVLIGESLSGQAATLRTSLGFIGQMGDTLGLTAQTKTGTSISYSNNLLDGQEWAVAGFVDGTLLSNMSITEQNQLNDFHYIFGRKFVGSTGVFINQSFTATSDTDDFKFIERNLVYNKAYRNIYAALLPFVNAPLVLNSDGTMTTETIEVFKNAGDNSLLEMKNNTEISGYSFNIDPTQKVLSTGILNVIASILPIGKAEQIDVLLGFTLSL